MSAPLAGVRVVEIATGIAVPYAAKLLVDAGAAVTRVEPPDDGDPLRRWTACAAEVAPGSEGPLYRFLHRGKTRVALDWTTAAGRARVAELIADADVVLESAGADAGVDWETLQRAAPRTSLVSVSPFGRSGPWRDRPATEFTLQAWSGSTAGRGVIERPPLAAGGRIGEWLGGGYAALAALTALVGARRSGRPTHADVSLLEAMHLSMAPFTTVADSLAGGAPLSSTVGSEAWNSRDLKSRPH